MAQAPRTLARRLHSISGVVPVGAFLAFHLWTNASARAGAEAYNATARRMQSLPLLVAIELFVVALPLFFHGVYGLFLMASPAEPRPPGRRRLAFAQRLTGAVLFAFVLFHLWTARLVQIRDHASLDLFRLMQASLANPWIRSAYVLGILAATFHFSAGLVTFAETWGLAPGARARRLVAIGAVLLFLSLSALGLLSIAAFRL